MMNRKLMLAEVLGLAMILTSPARAQTEDIYISASGAGTADGVSFADEDIVLCDRNGGIPGTCSWSMFFDGSAEGLSKASDTRAFHVEDDNNILMAFQTPKKIGNLKKVDDSDIVHFDRTAGPSSAFEFFFIGSDVGLTTDDESIDAIGFTPGGRLVISTDGDYSVPKTGGGDLEGGDEDLLVFNGTTDSSGTSGDFELYLDGSSIGLNSPQEDIWGAWVDSNTDEIYITTRGDYSVGSLTGVGTDIFICDPANFDPISSCATVNGFFVAEDEGFDDKIIDGIFIVNNTPPVAQDDNFTTDEDTVLAGASNVMDDNGNGADSDVDGDLLTVTAVNGSAANVGVQIALASGALLTVGADGSMSYDPNGQFESLGAAETALDGFGYTIDDGNGGTDSALVEITITGVNDAPVLDPVGNQTVDEETLLSFTATASDVESDTLSFSLSGAVPAGAGITAGGDFTWTPTEAQGPGPYTFDVNVADDGVPSLSDSETITVTVDEVNVAPVLDPVGDQTIDEETLLSFTATATDADVPPDTLTFSLAGAVPAGASITAGGLFSWTPTEVQGPGPYTFDVVVTDDGVPILDDSETITVTVDEVNVAPVLDPVGDQTVDEETLLSFTATATDADLPLNTLTFSLAGAVPAGASITAGGDFSWTPTEAQGPGPYTFDVVVTDDGAPNLGDSETITVTVEDVNNAPVLDAIGNQNIDEESLLSFTATATDADVPPDTLTFSLAGAVPAGASITAAGDFSWTPTEVQGPGPYTFDVVVTDDGVPNLDDSETITVTVDEVNLAPVLDPVGNQSIGEGFLLNFTATATDVDLPPNTLTFSLAGAVPAGAGITAGGLFSWTPTEAQGPGLYTFDVVVTDDGAPNLGDSETIIVTVDEVNVAPVLDPIGNPAIDELSLLSFTATATDADIPANALTFSLAGAVPAGASITPGGLFTWTPTEAQGPGPYTFDVVVIDDGAPNLADSETITVTVNEVNLAPVLDPIGNQNIDEGSLLSFTATATDPDLPPNTLAFSLAGAVPAGAGITAGGLFSWTPTEAQGPGSYTFDVVVNDNGAPNLADSETITVTVNELPDTDTIDDLYTGIIGNVGLNVPAGNGVLSNDLGGATAVTQVNGLGANVGVATATTFGLVTVQTDGSFLYEPNAGNFAADSFTYEADGVDTSTVDLTFGSDMIWFIDVTPNGAGNDGTLSDPFNSISGYNASSAGASQEVFIATGSYTGPLNLNSNSVVIGEGATGITATLLGVTEPADTRTLPVVGGTAPSITSAGNGIGLSTGNTIRGLTIGNTTGTGLSGTGVGTATVSETSINGTGAGVSINTGTLAMSFDEISSSNAAGITLSGVSGDFDVTTGTLDSGSATAVSIAGSPIDLGVTLTSVSANGAANGININNTTGSFTVAGDGGATQNDSGGSILNTVSDGISLTSTTNITLNQMLVDNTGRHGVFGTGVVNLTVNDSIFDHIGDADTEDAFSFKTESLGIDNNISGTLTLDNVDITNFHESGLHVYNETGTLTAHVIDSNVDDNEDTANFSYGVYFELEGDAGATLNVDGNTFTDVESDIVRFETNSSVSNSVNILDNTSMDGGGHDNFPNGGGIQVITDGGDVLFDIRGNILRDLPGDPIIIASTGGGGEVEGRIGGANVSDGNEMWNDPLSILGDGILLTGNDSLAVDQTWTVLIQNNFIGQNAAGTITTGMGDDGIAAVLGDNNGVYNITIEDNTIRSVAPQGEGIDFFVDEDDNNAFPAPVGRTRIVNNNIISVGPFEQAIEIDTREIFDGCFHIDRNNGSGGALTGEIDLTQGDTSILEITQASTVALATANFGSTVLTAGTITFNGTCTNPALPSL